jgi:LuxR family transcriptional regulator
MWKGVGMSKLGPEASSVDDGASVVLHLHRLYAATRIEQAWELHVRRMADYGFDRILYSNACLPGGVGVLRDTLILSNHTHAFLDLFLTSGMWRKGVYVRRAEERGLRAVPWRLPPDHLLTDEDRRVLAFRASHDVVAGYSISFRGIGAPGRAATGLCARRGLDQDAVDEIWARFGPAIEVMCIAFHLRVSTLPVDLPGRTLTPRQREVLSWASQGKSVQDIAQLMGLTIPTVEKHLRLARAALGVQTTTMAVLKASFLNQLHRVGPSSTVSIPGALPLASDAQ